MPELGIHCVKRADSGAGLTDFGKAARVSLLLVLSCAMSPAFAQASEVACPVGSQVMTGSGTESTPYQVTDICQLQGISSRPAAYYVLMDNIDASTTKDWNGGAGFRPIASTATDGFSGSFVNPGKHEISLLTISRSTETYVGLFSRLAAGATIQGVILVGSRTTGRDSVGSLVGFSDGVTDNNSATGSVFGQSNVGGLVGFSSSRSSIDNSYATGSVSGVSQVGGVVGNNFGSINYTYATSTVIGTGSIVGGLVGFSRGDISDSYATGSVSGGSLVGGLVGFINSGDISGSYATGSVSGDDVVGGLTGYQDFGIGITDSYATGSVSGGDRVGGLTGFQEVNSSITDSYATGSVIGRADHVGGLVGDQERDSSIRDSYATGSVSGDNHVGGLVGNSLGFISSSSATGSVSGAGDNIGGLVGNSLGFIRDSHAASAVTGQFSVGGLVGNSLGFISNSSATGSVFGTGGNIGGLVGNQEFSSSIRDSYATGSVSGDYFIGGFVGNGLGFVSNSYATGSVSGDYFIGGLVGFLGSSSSIRDSYATGSVSGDYSVGGLVGRGNGNIANSYYAARGWNNGLGEERTFTQLRCLAMPGAVACPTESPKSSYQGWDARVWDFGSATDLPQLLSNRNSDLNRKPYIKTPSGSVDIDSTRVKLLFLEADYLGSPGEPVTLTWSLSGVPSSLRHLVYFDLGGGTTSTTFTDNVKPSSDSSTIKLVVNGELAGRDFDVVLKNDISANDDRIQIRVRIAVASPLVTGGRLQTRTIPDNSFSSFLVFDAIDGDSPDSGGTGLSWSFFSRDGIAEGTTVLFSSTQRGGTVEVEVRRNSLGSVGSFVLEIENLAGVKIMVVVTIETVCSPIPGADLMADQAGTGTPVNPYRIERLCQLQDISSRPAAYYELMDDIDASETEDWNNGAGFKPIATFSGSFVNTDNYVISSLTIDRDSESFVGLFSKLAKNGRIEGIRLVGSRTTGKVTVGSLVGRNYGVVEDSSAAGSVSGENRLGGLVGWNDGDINNGYATGTVSGVFISSNTIGGLVGLDTGDSISRSSATGSVSGGSLVGGLVGDISTGEISRSYAAVTVTGTYDRVGGLVGYQDFGTSISNSSATGSVSGRNQVGGLVGNQDERSRISNSYATGSVFGQDQVGGLVGIQVDRSRISNSYATGSVSGQDQVGGLVGIQVDRSRISNSYATGSVSGQDQVGGLVGRQESNASISDSYATVSVSGRGSEVGGLVGSRGVGNIDNSYFAARGQNNGLGEERTFVQLRCLTTLGETCPSGSQESSYQGWDPSVWGFGSAMDLPQLSSNQNPELNLKPYIESSTELVVGVGIPGITRFSLEANYLGPPAESVTLTWSLLFNASSTLSDFVCFELEDGTTSTEANGSAATLVVVSDERLVGRSFYVVLKNNISADSDRVRVRVEGVKQPYIVRDNAVSAMIGRITTFNFSVGYTGSPGEPATLTWSLSGVPSTLSHLVYFDLGGGTTSTTFTDSAKLTDSASPVTLVVVGNEGLAGKSLYVMLTNKATAKDDRVAIRIVGASPSVNGKGGREQTRMIWGGSTSILSFGAVDRDSPDSDGAGLSWNFFSRDGIAEGSAVVFSSTTKGGAVEVEVRRSSLDLYDVGSFVLEVTSPAGVKTTFTVTIETVCSPVSGEDLMTGQAGKGTSGSPYQIERLCQLQDISSSPTAYHVLVADIDASRTRGWNGGAGFEPLASFSGSFVSTRHHRESTRNYVISSLTISRSGTDHVGLFSRLAEGATIRGVTLVGSSVIGGLTVGSLVGSNAGVIEGCSVTGSVSGRSQVGGLVGSNRGGNISNSYATGSVDGQDSVGGLVGNQTQASRISNSYATGLVSARTNNVGGLVGNSSGEINNSYATGSVSGRDEIGGLVGNSSGEINNSYATGSVFGQNQVGGLVGYQESNSSINDSYATGSVSGQDQVGGLVGDQDDSSRISNSYATGSVSGRGNEVGGLVGRSKTTETIRNSYFAARGQNNGLGEERTFVQLRCLTTPGETCPSGSQESSYQGWDTSVWVFGSAMDLPQLLSNRNSDLNLKPYIKGSSELVVRSGYMGITRFSLEADYPGPPGESVVLTWSLLFNASSTLSDFVYFELEDGTTSTEANGSAAMLAVVRDDLMEGKGFYVVLKNNISANDDRIRVRIEEEKQPYILRDDDIRPAPIGSTNTFSFSVAYAGPAGKPVTLTWSLLGVPASLRYLAYFDLGDGKSSTTFTDSSVFTDSASTVTLVVVGDKELAGMSFYVVLENNISVNDDRVLVQVGGEKQPFILRDDGIRLAGVEVNTTFSLSVGYAGSPEVSVDLTWSLSGVPTTLRHLVYFDLGDGTTSTVFTDSAKFTDSAIPVTLVVVGNKELAGRSFYVVLKNDISANDDRVRVDVEEEKQPYILQSDDIRQAWIDVNTTFSLSVGYAGTPGIPVTLTWSLFGVPSTLSHLVYFDLGGGTISTTVTDNAKLTDSASPVTLVVVGDKELVGRDFSVVLENNISAKDDRVAIRVVGVSPLVDGGREQTRMIWGGSTSILSFGAIDRDSPDSDGAGLSWNFFSRDGIAEGSSVVFSSTTKGGAVEVEVRRSSLDLYDVGSFVLEVTSPAGVKTTFTVTIETVCSPVSGGDLMAGQTGTGISGNPYQIDRLCQLQDISSSPTAHHVLVADIDASRTRDWNGGAGFEPIARFSGSFVSTRRHRESTRNYEIRSLWISRSNTNHVGLFSRLAEGATIRGVILDGSGVTGLDVVGSLVGLNSGVIEGCSATGSVFGRYAVGGLVGESRGSISNSSATGSVFGRNYVGGLQGYQLAGSGIRDSYATGSVVGTGSFIGGLAGYLRGDIRNSYATGSVSGSGHDIGGLVGRHGGILIGNGTSVETNVITDSYATGSVVGGREGCMGGLVGYEERGSNIIDSYATGSVSGQDKVGGLTGCQFVYASISNSYATGSVSGGRVVGGLVGEFWGSISNSYATGSVSGRGDNVGGLVGEFRGSISNSYATGSVSGRGDNVGGLVGRRENAEFIRNSYYAARGRNNDLGEERTFKQLRCPTMSSETCGLPGSDQRTYENWDTNVWDFGSATELPQLPGNRNSELNLKPYISGSVDLVAVIGPVGTTQLSLVADYLGPPRKSVTLTWSLSGVPTKLRHLVYFDLGGGTTSTTFTDSAKLTDSASSVTLVVVGNKGLPGRSFYVVLENNISANDDRVRVDVVEEKQPYILQSDDIRLAEIEVNTTFSLSVGYAGPAEQPVTLTWSLSGVPATLRHLVYFDLGGGATSTTFADPGKLTDSASTATLVVVGNKELAGRSFYVVLKNDISANDDRVLVQVGEEKQPYILQSDDIRLAEIEVNTTFSLSTDYAGSPGVPVTLTWSLSGVPATLRHLVYFDLGDGKSSTTFTDSAVFTDSAGTATLVVVGNKELAGRSFYVVLKNDISVNGDRALVQVGEEKQPYILRDDDLRPAPIGSTNTFSLSVGYAGPAGQAVDLTWSLSGVPATLRHLVYFDLGGGTTSTTFTESAVFTDSASTVALVVVGNRELAGRSFYVVLENDISVNDDRLLVQVGEDKQPYILRDEGVRLAEIEVNTTFSLSVGYAGTPGVPVTLTWSLSGVPATLRRLVYFDLGDGTTSTTVTDSAKLTDSASPVTLVVVGNKELAGISFYVVLKNDISVNDDRVRVRVGEEKQPYILQSDDIRLAEIEVTTTFSLSVSYAGTPGIPVTLTWSLSGVPVTLRHLAYFDLGDGTTSTTVTDIAKLTDSASTVTLVVVGNKGLAGRSFYVVLENNISVNDDRVRVDVEEEKQPYILQSDDIRQAGVEGNTTFSLSVSYAGTPGIPVDLTWSLSGVPTTLRHLAYFDLGDGATSTTVTDPGKLTDSASTVTLVVVGNKELAGRSFYVVLKNNISVNEDRVRVDVEEEKQPYILQSDDIRQAGVEGNTTFSLSVGYAGTPGIPVDLTWSLSGVPTTLRHLVYFDLGDGTTSTTVTDSAKLTDSASTVTLVVVGNKGLADTSFYVVLKNDISVNEDRVRVDVEKEKQPYILQSDDIRQAEVEGNTTFSLSVGYAGTPGIPVTLTWSLSGVPTTLRHLVYFDLGDGTTSTTVTDSAKLTDSASTVTLVVVGNKGLADTSFYVVLKNDISVNDDRVRVDVEEEKQPYILRDDDIRPAPIGSTNTFSFSVGYAGTPGVPVTLTWSLSGVPATLRHLVYFDLGGGTTSTTVTDIAKFTDSASTVTLVVVGNKKLAGRSFYVVLENDISVNDDRLLVQVGEDKQPYILRGDGIRLAKIEANNTFGFSVSYAGTPGVPVTLTWSLSGVPTMLRHLVYFDLGDGTTSTTVTDSAKLTDSASPVRLVVVGNKELAGISFYVVLKNDISVNEDRVRVDVEEEKQPYILQGDDIRQAGVEGNTTFSLSVGYAGTPGIPVDLTWSLSGVPTSLRHLVYFDLGDGTTSTTVTDIAKLTDSAGTATLVVVGNKELAGISFYVVLKNDISVNDDRVRVDVEEEKQPYILQSDDIRQAGVEGNTTFSLSVGYAGTPEVPVTLTWSLSGVPATLRHLVYFDLGDGTTSTTVTDIAKLTDSASPVTLVVVGNKGLAGISFYVVLKNDISANDDRILVDVEEEKQPYILQSDDIRQAGVEGNTTFSLSVAYAGTPEVPVTLTWSLSGVPATLRHLVYFDLGGGTTSTTVTDSAKLTDSASTVTLVVVGNKGLAGRSFYVVLKNDISVNDDRILVDVEEEKQPYILQSDDIRQARSEVNTTFSLSVGYAGTPGVPVTLTWSLSGVPTTLRHLVYFDLGGGTTSTTVTDSAKLTDSASTVTLVVEGNKELAGRSFYVVLKNDISVNDDRVLVQSLIPGLRPFVGPDGRDQIVMIWEGLTRTTLRFSATDGDSPDDGSGLSWDFFSTDRIAEGSAVRFNSTQKGSVVEVEVRRRLDLRDVGSFVLGVESRAGVKTTFTVTVKTVCSSVPGADLMAGQAGTGTSDDPYQIKRLCQLQDVSSSPSAHYELAADIDGNSPRMLNGGAGFEPIASTAADGFSGSFVSTNNYVISSLTISRSSTDNVGLFSRLAAGATIRGVILVGSRTIGRDNVGSLAGSNNRGVIEDCSVLGSVSGGNRVGGLVGYSLAGGISNSYAAGLVSGQGNVGGLVGNQGDGSSISDSYATGSVFGTGENIGGLVGNQGDGSSISNTYATGSVFGTGESIGGLVGYQVSSSIVNSYYAARGRSNSLGEERTFAQLRCPTMVRRFCLLGSQENTYEDWDANVWDFGSATDLPQLSSNRSLDLNLKPYVKGSADLVVTVSAGVTQLSLEADYLGPPGESVTLTWSLSGVPTSLRDLVYFSLGGGSTSTMFTDPGKPTSGASTATLVVVGSGLAELVGKVFYVVLKNDVSGDVDRVPIQVLQEAPTVLTRPLRVKVYLGGAVR